jgi:hypothetical protein
LAAVVLTAGGLNLGRAQDQQVTVQEPPETGRGVARVSLINGDVSVRRGDTGDWVAAVANAPVLVNDHLATGAAARAEVQFDYSNFLRVGANAEVQFAQMEQNRYQVQVSRGIVDFSVLRQTNADIEVDTPAVSVRPRSVGNYRISVLDDGQAEITVRLGQAEIYTPSGVEQLAAGKTMMVRGDPANPEFQIVAAIAPDDWDRWNADRDARLNSAGNNVYNRYVSPDIAGAESLEGNGRWTYAPDYGYVWSPTVAPGWAPYQSGRWAWEDYYGWTWVSYDPWGWAPYHYGRWFFNAGYGGWCWWPGPIHARYFWAPAYVGFFGFGGGGFGVGFGFGNVGWVPLAPFEVFHPWWGRGFYGRGGFFAGRTTIVNNFNVYNTFRNARVMNGVTAVNSRDFASGRFNSFARVSPNDLRSAGMVQGHLGISPSAGSRAFSNRVATVTPRTSATSQRFFTRNGPTTSSSPRTFGTNSAPTISGGRGNGVVPSPTGSSPRAYGPAGQSGAPSAQMNRGGGPVNNGATPGGWRRFGEPGGQSAPSGANPSRGGNGNPGSWQRFGSPGGSAPRQQFSSPGQSSGGRLQVSPPMVRERSSPQYGQPGGGYNSAPSRPGYSAPQRPSYSAPPPRPSYSAPSRPSNSAPQYSRPSGGGYSAPNSGGGRSYGGGGAHSSGGGGGHSSGGGGGHSSSSSHGGRR